MLTVTTDEQKINGWDCWYRADLGYWHARKGWETASGPTKDDLLAKIAPRLVKAA